jgi:competence ComEA-like helix-hairpin-helix protein
LLLSNRQLIADTATATASLTTKKENDMRRKPNKMALLIVLMIACSFVFSHAEGTRVNINTADEATLVTLNYIGKSRAQAIIAYREEHGPFKSIEELKGVSGVGERVFESIKDKITVDHN